MSPEEEAAARWLDQRRIDWTKVFADYRESIRSDWRATDPPIVIDATDYGAITFAEHERIETINRRIDERIALIYLADHYPW